MDKNTVYILQKDLPDHEAGTEFHWDNERGKYKTEIECLNAAQPYSCFMKQFVENNPEWFKPKEEVNKSKPTEQFQWTNDLVFDCCVYLYNTRKLDGQSSFDMIEDFKKSKAPQSKSKKEEQNPCNYCGKPLREQMNGCKESSCYRQFLKKEEPQWEILTFDWDGKLWKCIADNVYSDISGSGRYYGTDELIKKSKINSVKRLSDNTV